MAARERVLVGNTSDFAAGTLKAVNVKGTSIVIAHTTDGICAVKNQCSHMPLSLAGGKLDGDTLTCPWHNSTFNVCTGENIDWVKGVAGVTIPSWSRRLLAFGKKPQGLQTDTVVEEDGKVFVEV